MSERIYTQEEIDALVRELEVARASVPVLCKRCGKQIPRFNAVHNPEDALEVTLDGGYAMFVDEPAWKFYLCGSCCGELCTFLGIDLTDGSWGGVR